MIKAYLSSVSKVQVLDGSNQGGRAANSDSSEKSWCSCRYSDQENSPRDNCSFNLAAGRWHRIYPWRTYQAPNSQQPWRGRQTKHYRDFTFEDRTKPHNFGTHFIHGLAHSLEGQDFPSISASRVVKHPNGKPNRCRQLPVRLETAESKSDGSWLFLDTIAMIPKPQFFG